MRLSQRQTKPRRTLQSGGSNSLQPLAHACNTFNQSKENPQDYEFGGHIDHPLSESTGLEDQK